MKKICLLLFPFLCVVAQVFGQQDAMSPVQSKWEKVGEYVELNYYNSDYCDYYLVSSRNKEIRVFPGKNNLVRVPFDQAAKYKNDPTFMQSSFKTYKGYFPENLNPDFIYSLPIKAGDSTSYVIDNKKPFKTYLFKVKAADTIYAVRSGVVCIKQNQGLNNNEIDLENKGVLLVYHADCSFAFYENMKDLFVRPGEEIEVGQPIGLSSSKGELLMTFFFLDKNKFKGANTNGKPHTHFNPVFHTTFGNSKLEEKKMYVNEWNDEVITQEMSKREKKKYAKKKLKMAEAK
jgi:hypothetical protein